MLRTEYDEVLGIVRLIDKGFYSAQDEESAAEAARPAIKRCRERNGDLKLLVVCGSEAQEPEVMEAAARRCDQIHAPHDRVAFVFPSSLAKMQAGRYFNAPHRQCFISENAAITWLLADRGMARVKVA